MLAITGDRVKYNIPLIITIFMSVNIFLTVLLGEHLRSLDPKLMELQKEYKRLKNKN